MICQRKDVVGEMNVHRTCFEAIKMNYLYICGEFCMYN